MRPVVEQLRFLALNNQRIFSYFLLPFLLATISACSSPIKPSVFEPSWMSYDKQKQQVNIELVAAWNANNNGYNFNGYFLDDITITVPAGWLVNMTLINLDANAAHSILITEPYTDDIPDELTGEFAVLHRAYTDSVYANESAEMKFKAKAGDYWIFCGVKGHAINGMWVKFKADKNINTPFIKIQQTANEIRY